MHVRRLLSMCLFALGLAGTVSASAAHAQASNLGTNPRGACADGRINYVFTTMTMVPNGTGSTGECNPDRYAGGPTSWTSQQALNLFVVHSRDCTDPWIGELYFDVYGRKANSIQCDASHYGGGKWTSFGDLSNKIRDYQSAIKLNSNQMLFANDGDMLNNQGQIMKANAIQTVVLLISQDGSGLVGPSGGTLAQRTAIVNKMTGLTAAQKSGILNENGAGATPSQRAAIVAQGGGNLTAAEKAMIVAQGGGNIILNGGSTMKIPVVGNIITLPTSAVSFYSVASAGGRQALNVTSVR